VVLKVDSVEIFYDKAEINTISETDNVRLIPNLPQIL